MAVFILHGENDILGAYSSEHAAQCAMKKAYSGGYFGELKITECEVES